MISKFNIEISEDIIIGGRTKREINFSLCFIKIMINNIREKEKRVNLTVRLK